MSAPWSAEQQQWLGVLGHVLYVQGAVAMAEDTTAVTEASPTLVRPLPVDAPVRAHRTGSPVATAPLDSPAVTSPALPRRGSARLPDKLHFALIRAAACNPNAPGAAELIAQWPPTSELRGNPAAKRALWPRLRALRRTGPQ